MWKSLDGCWNSNDKKLTVTVVSWVHKALGLIIDLGYHEHPSKLERSSSKNDTSQKKNLSTCSFLQKMVRRVDIFSTFQLLKDTSLNIYIYHISLFFSYIYTHNFVLCAMFQSHQSQTKPSKKKKKQICQDAARREKSLLERPRGTAVWSHYESCGWSLGNFCSRPSFSAGWRSPPNGGDCKVTKSSRYLK